MWCPFIHGCWYDSVCTRSNPRSLHDSTWFGVFDTSGVSLFQKDMYIMTSHAFPLYYMVVAQYFNIQNKFSKQYSVYEDSKNSTVIFIFIKLCRYFLQIAFYYYVHGINSNLSAYLYWIYVKFFPGISFSENPTQGKQRASYLTRIVFSFPLK